MKFRDERAGGARVLTPGLVLAQRFELIEKIGVGGFGEVWRARHINLGIDVALKVLNAAAVEHAEIAMIEERFRFEAQISAMLAKKTEHVTVVHDAGVSEVGPFLAMELVVGRSLEAMIDDGPLAPHAVASLLVAIGQALDAAHASGIVHRDLKPSNVLIGPKGEVKLIDFGISKAIGSTCHLERPKATDARFFMGTPEYMSPEQIGSGAPISAAADFWALGVLAYEALTAKMPFGGESAAETLVRIAQRGFTPPSTVRPDLPRALDGWFTRALAKEPSARFTSGREAAEAFALAIQRRTTTRRKSSLLSEAPPISILPPDPRRGNVGWFLGAALVSLAFVATLAAVNARSRVASAGFVEARVAPAFIRATARATTVPRRASPTPASIDADSFSLPDATPIRPAVEPTRAPPPSSDKSSVF